MTEKWTGLYDFRTQGSYFGDGGALARFLLVSSSEERAI